MIERRQLHRSLRPRPDWRTAPVVKRCSAMRVTVVPSSWQGRSRRMEIQSASGPSARRVRQYSRRRPTSSRRVRRVGARSRARLDRCAAQDRRGSRRACRQDRHSTGPSPRPTPWKTCAECPATTSAPAACRLAAILCCRRAGRVVMFAPQCGKAITRSQYSRAAAICSSSHAGGPSRNRPYATPNRAGVTGLLGRMVGDSH